MPRKRKELGRDYFIVQRQTSRDGDYFIVMPPFVDDATTVIRDAICKLLEKREPPLTNWKVFTPLRHIEGGNFTPCTYEECNQGHFRLNRTPNMDDPSNPVWETE